MGEREEVATEPETDPATGLEEAQEATETALLDVFIGRKIVWIL